MTTHNVLRGPRYDYTPDGKLARRTWARGIDTDYSYDNAGQLVSTTYSDTTPTITMSYDRVGNILNATTEGVVTNLYAYNLVGNCTNEWQNDFNLTRYFDNLGRSTGYAINGERQTTITYDTFGRLASMRTAERRSGVLTASNENEFVWSYLPNSDLKASLLYPNGLTASWQYDAKNQLLQVRNATPTNIISQFDYTYDATGRRTAITKTGAAFGDLSGSIDSYTYNARSELTSARRTKNGQPIPGFSEDFDYDPIGNRRSSATYNEKGEAQTSTYEANNLNQYTTRTTPGYAAVRGEADSNATVTVNENPTFRLGSYYFGSDLFDNTASGGLASLETYATLGQTAANGDEAEDLVTATTNQVYLAQSPETFAYDDDGNQTLITTKTGLWRVTYNGENRPIRWENLAPESNNQTISNQTILSMSYDHMGRRREKNAQRFFYDGYLQVADNYGNAYTWDCTEGVATRPLVWNNFAFVNPHSLVYYTHDGNKNVGQVITSDGSIAAYYEYAPFGAIIAMCGEKIMVNPWRYSSEFADTELDCIYYNYRYCDAESGRWLSRDPIEEVGGINVYLSSGNAPVRFFDVIGCDATEDISHAVGMLRGESVVYSATGIMRAIRVRFTVRYSCSSNGSAQFEDTTVDFDALGDLNEIALNISGSGGKKLVFNLETEVAVGHEVKIRQTMHDDYPSSDCTKCKQKKYLINAWQYVSLHFGVTPSFGWRNIGISIPGVSFESNHKKILSYYKPKTIRFIVCCSCSDPAKAKCKVDDGNDEAHEE